MSGTSSRRLRANVARDIERATSEAPVRQ